MSRLRSAALVLALVGCAPGSDGSPQVVLQRVERLESASGLRFEAAPRLRGGSWRNAFATPGGEVFEIEADGRARELLFDVAPGPKAPLHVSVGVADGGGWRSLLAETIPSEPAGAEAWHPLRVPLPDAAGGPHRLRLAAGGADDGATAYWSAPILLGPPRGGEPGRPNIVLISLDTLAAEHLGAFGSPAAVSPRIDAFLGESCSFRLAFAQFPNTLISHASLFSGLYPRRHGTYLGKGFPGPSLVERLAESGYRTLAFTEGGFVGGTFGFTRGFDAYDDGPGAERIDAAETFGAAARWLGGAGARERFFLFVHSYEVHFPHRPRDAEAAAVVRRLSPLPAHGELALLQIQGHNRGRLPFPDAVLDHLRALYASEIHYLDRAVGRFLEELDRLGLAERTLVVLTSDHGEEFGEHGKIGHGGTLYNRVLHVPLGFRWPGTIRRGERSTPVQLIDVMPTLLDLAGVGRPADLDGQSLAASILADADPPARPAFAELRGSPKRERCPPDAPDGPCRIGRYAVQTRDFKLIASWDPPLERLFDLRADPLETRDVSAEHPREVAAQRRHLDAYLAGPAAAGAPDLPLDPSTREDLEALGYIDEQGAERPTGAGAVAAPGSGL